MIQPGDYITTCKICKKPFISTAFEPQIIGAAGQRIFDFGLKLHQHLEREHPDHMHRISGSMQQYMMFLLAQVFVITDPELLDMVEAIRAALRHFSQRLTITDDEILHRVAQIELAEPEQEEGVNLLIRDLRDLLTETGRHAPTFTQKPLISA